MLSASSHSRSSSSLRSMRSRKSLNISKRQRRRHVHQPQHHHHQHQQNNKNINKSPQASMNELQQEIIDDKDIHENDENILQNIRKHAFSLTDLLSSFSPFKKSKNIVNGDEVALLQKKSKKRRKRRKKKNKVIKINSQSTASATNNSSDIKEDEVAEVLTITNKKNKNKTKKKKKTFTIIDNGVTDDQIPIQLHFVGLRPLKPISQMTEEFNSHYGKAEELEIIAEYNTDSDAELKKTEDNNNNDTNDEYEVFVDEGVQEITADILKKEDTNLEFYPRIPVEEQKSTADINSVKFREFWPVYHQITKHSQECKDVNHHQTSVVEFQEFVDAICKKNLNQSELEDKQRIESGKIDYKTIAGAADTDTDSDSTNIYLSTTVRQLKDMIYERYEVPRSRNLLLIYSHIILVDDHRTLKFYGVENNSFILICIGDVEIDVEACETAFEPAIAPPPKIEIFTNNNDDDEEKANENAAEETAVSAILNARRLLLNSFLRRHVTAIANGENPSEIATAQLVVEEQPSEAELAMLATQKRIEVENQSWRKMSSFKLERMTDLDIFMYTQDENCIRMPCGHGMVQETLFEYCKSQWKDNKQRIKCPHMIRVLVVDENATADEREHKAPEMKEVKCNAVWEYPIIRRVLMATIKDVNANINLDEAIAAENEKKVEAEKRAKFVNNMKLELLSARATAQEHYDLQKCGKCSTIIYRKKQSLKDLVFCSVCPLCTVYNRKVAIYKFEESMLDYEQYLYELNQWKVTTFLKNLPPLKDFVQKTSEKSRSAAFSKLVNKSNAIQFYQRKEHRPTLPRVIEEYSSSSSAAGNLFGGDHSSSEESSAYPNLFATASESEYEPPLPKIDPIAVPEVQYLLEGYETEPESEYSSYEDENESHDSSAPECPILFDPSSDEEHGYFYGLFDYYRTRINNITSTVHNNNNDNNNTETRRVRRPRRSNAGNGVRLPPNIPPTPIPAPQLVPQAPQNMMVVDSSEESSFTGPGLFGGMTSSSSSESETSSDEDFYVSLYTNSGNDSNDELFLSPFLSLYQRDKRQKAFCKARGIPHTDIHGNYSANSVPKKIIVPKRRRLSEKELFTRRMHRRRQNFYKTELKEDHYESMYCWGCGDVWKNRYSASCGNPHCSTSYRAQILSMLGDCETKTIG